MDNTAENTLQYDCEKEERIMETESREAAYCSALSSLSHQCDSLHNEALKLRTLRKSRRGLETQCVQAVLRSHSDEVMAVGQTLANNASLNVSTVTSDLRVAIQHQRNQLSQLRMLLEAVKSAEAFPMPRGSKLVLSIQRQPVSADETDQKRPFIEIDDLFAKIYANSREVNDTSIAEAILQTLVHGREDGSIQAKHFARRSANRKTQ